MSVTFTVGVLQPFLPKVVPSSIQYKKGKKTQQTTLLRLLLAEYAALAALQKQPL